VGHLSPAENLLDADLGGIDGDKITLQGGKPFTNQCLSHLVDITNVNGGYRHGCLVYETVLAVGYLLPQVEMREAMITLPSSAAPTPVTGATPIFVRTAATCP